MEKKILKICEINKGYEYEGPRFIRLGPYSGEEFRDTHLMPWLNSVGEKEETIIDFEGTKMYSPSFLEESFGGAIREAQNQQESEANRQKLKLVEFINIDSDWKKKLEGYIENAKFKSKNGNGVK